MLHFIDCDHSGRIKGDTNFFLTCPLVILRVDITLESEQHTVGSDTKYMHAVLFEMQEFSKKLNTQELGLQLV